MSDLTPVEIIDRAIAERSLSEFIKQSWRQVDPSPYLHNWHIDALAEHLEAVMRREIRVIIFNIPPRCMKSLAVNVFFPAYVWAQDPDPDKIGDARHVRPDAWAGPGVRFLSASHDHDLATRDNVKCRRLIDGKWFRRNWPDRVTFTADQNTKSRYENMQGGARFTTGVAAGVTGEGGDIIIVDDPIDAKKANSETIRDDCLRWWFESMPTRLNDFKRGCRIIVMQRLHERDLTGAILARESGWDHLMLPMELEYRHPHPTRTKLGYVDQRILEGKPEGALLWESRIGPVELKKLETDLGAYASAGQLQQRPAPREGGLFKESWFIPVDAIPAGCRRVRAWDFAATLYEGSGDPDWTVGVLMAVDKDGMFYVEKVVRERLSPAGVERLVKDTAEADGKTVEICLPQDPGSAGKTVAQYYVKRLAGWRVHVERPTGDKPTRAQPFASQAEAGNVRMLKASWNDAYLGELSTFPMGSHDDQVDASSDAFSRLVLKPKPARGAHSSHMER